MKDVTFGDVQTAIKKSEVEERFVIDAVLRAKLEITRVTHCRRLCGKIQNTRFAKYDILRVYTVVIITHLNIKQRSQSIISHAIFELTVEATVPRVSRMRYINGSKNSRAATSLESG